MHVLQPGKLPGERKHIGTCSNCGCKVEFKENEARYISHQFEPGWAVKCPTEGCNQEIYV